MRNQAIAIIEEILTQFEGLEVLYKYDAKEREYIFGILDEEVYTSEVFLSILDKIIIDSLYGSSPSVVFAGPDDYIDFSEAEKLSINDLLNPFVSEHKGLNSLFERHTLELAEIGEFETNMGSYFADTKTGESDLLTAAA